MTRIGADVEDSHLRTHPTERDFLQPFLPLFDITYATSHQNFGTTASIYFLKPMKRASQTFGFEREVLLAYSPYTRFEPRLVQLVDKFLTHAPARTRVESLCYIVVHDDPNIRDSLGQLMASSIEAKTMIPFARPELASGADHWFVQRRIADHFFSRDLFDISQALVEDTYFFGRQGLVQDLLDRFKRVQTTGLFGLRKTGKTSIISKVNRTIQTSGLGFSLVLDAQDPALYQQRWWELLGTIVMGVADATGIQPTRGLAPFAEADTAAAGFAASMNYIFTNLKSTGPRGLLIIDEFEHLCPKLSLQPHWNQDFLPFWQTIRAYQTRYSRLSCLVVGVNPSAAEQTTINGHDNPLFSLVSKLFMPSFSTGEVRDMIRTLGRYMGLHFEDATYDYLRSRYGGHPMLIRLACSWMHRHLSDAAGARPLSVTQESFLHTEADRDRSLAPYARHILDVLSTWYPLEYEMLEMLCLGQEADYESLLAQDPQLREHLIGYGLIEAGQASNASGMILDYVRGVARRKVTTADISTDKTSTAQVWTTELEQLSDAIVHSRSYCQEIASIAGVEPIFEDDKMRVGAKLADLRVTPLSNGRAQFEGAVNTLQQLFWDSIPPARRQTLEGQYPSLYTTANVIRCLRHWLHHPELTDPAVRATVVEYVQTEVGGFPSGPTDWAQLHLDLMRRLISSLKEAQARIYAGPGMK